MASNLTGDPQGAAHGIYDWSSTPKHALGARLTTGDGRVFRYALAGAVALVPGNALQASAPVANHLNLTPVAAAVGDLTVTVALGATAATANQYAGGLLVISTAPGNGYQYRIKSHPAAALSTSVVVTLEDPIQVALTTSSRCDLYAHQYNGVIQTPVTTLTGVVVGGAVAAIAIANYGWIQTKGPFAGLIDGTPAVGMGLSCPAAVAGGFAINSSTLDIVATAQVLGVDTKNKLVNLRLE